MKLSKIAINCKIIGSDLEIEGLTMNSKNVKKGDLFFAIVGKSSDGHDFIAQAIQNGASAIVVEREQKFCPIAQVIVQDSRIAMSVMAALFFNNPSRQLKLIGVTGTNGKTTVSHILQGILKSWGKSVCLIGTLGVIVNGQAVKDDEDSKSLTTPDPIELHKTLAMLVQKKVEYVVMEISAHSIALKKIEGLFFESIIFTNFSRDHLDFFETVQNYKRTKALLFTKKYTNHAVLNIDDDMGVEIASSADFPVLTYGCNRPADVFAINLTMNCHGLKYFLNCMDNIANINFCLPGEFNMYNTLAAAATAHILGAPIKKIVQGIKSVEKVDGRFNIINTDTFSVIVDFAHTDDGLANLLKAVREFSCGKILCVFGCGGDRDQSKRSLMGFVASKYSDIVILTNDNPRFENPNKIISHIEQGVKMISSTYYECISDRKEAIKRSFELAGKDDLIVIAGKGAENTQEINGTFHSYNDLDFVKSLL
ncbi:MAG: UDP-N-acetylmuramoyl-L-alanyl-D-glutamate--2,6-diaminopimelate ligase [Clostridiales bacterium]|jgi:UDP-N-acetylmuramoyl-L-alanyl-D-glutamate--2,6-diaminopimelate ligase|nr:UDP-N-acetylmuramoyl-L-alanyl-D-glutamate--2,6-diaminopimelate ligase [Clostridiales bacterium]